MQTSPILAFLLLLLLGLSKANPLLEEKSGEEILIDDEKAADIDISTRILETNDASGELLLEGDLMVPRTRNAMSCWNSNCLWKKSDNGFVIVPYTISDEFGPYEMSVIAYAIKVFNARSCIRFMPRQNEHDYISIENRGGCFSALGRIGGEQPLSLNKNSCFVKGIVQHEMLHALGFRHEQTRSDRDQHVRINWEHIEQSNAFNFYKHNTNNLDTPYDYNSVMHYGRRAFSIDGEESITPIPNDARIGQRDGMSRTDVLRLNRLYGC